MKNRNIKVAVCITALLVVIVFIGLNHEERRPSQHANQYWAVRTLSVWSFFGTEIYASNELAVYDMTDRTTRNLRRPINTPVIQIRRFGKIVEGDNQFNLGENAYDRDGCLDYIYWTLGSSSDVSHRIAATTIFYGSAERYPLASTLMDKLIDDPCEAVRSKAHSILVKQH
jgi:hypothetical protein